MAPVRNSQREKRVARACENCRRKKARCPGERPVCSNCTRLRQQCEYKDSGNLNISNQLAEARALALEARLAELEERIDLISDEKHIITGEIPVRSEKAADNARRSASTYTTQHCSPEAPERQRAESWIRSLEVIPKNLPTKAVIVQAFEIYFTHCHRQPLWLFADADSLRPDDCCEELLFPILALASRYTRCNFQDGQTWTFESCCTIGRTVVMMRIATGTVVMPTLQSMCLLALASFIATNISLCRWYIYNVKTLIQNAGLDVELPYTTEPDPDERRRLFWSLFHLEQLCGFLGWNPMLSNMQSPTYYTPLIEGHSTKLACRAFPHEAFDESEVAGPGIWAHMVRLCSVWRHVRSYVSRYATNDIQAPWMAGSEYNWVNARMLDFESTFLDFYRYPNAQFTERSAEEIHNKRTYWLPWIWTQLFYHTIHTVLNHPFLHAATDSITRFGHNVFWRTSLDSASLHANWISRIIEICDDVGLEVADPFLAHSAAVAASIHLYHSRSDDLNVRDIASTHLDTCRSFLDKLARHWPICRLIGKTLDDLISLSQTTDSNEIGKITLNTSVMWKILDPSCLAESVDSQENLFGTSLSSTSVAAENTTDQTTLQTMDVADAVLTSDSAQSYAQPLSWFDALTSPSTAGTNDGVNISAAIDQNMALPVGIPATPAQDPSLIASTASLSETDILMDVGTSSFVHLLDHSDGFAGWLNYGNL